MPVEIGGGIEFGSLGSLNRCVTLHGKSCMGGCQRMQLVIGGDKGILGAIIVIEWKRPCYMPCEITLLRFLCGTICSLKA